MRIISFVICVFIAIAFTKLIFSKAIKELQSNYIKADTSIVVTNGRADTVITKKTLPWYLK